MSTPNANDVQAYVDAALALHKLPLDAERRAAVIEMFALLADMAQRMETVALPEASEPAPVYRP